VLSQALCPATPSCASLRYNREFKKIPGARLDEVARKKGIDSDKIEVWFQDEARIGQNNKITRRWAREKFYV
jgi:hypothetical protein